MKLYLYLEKSEYVETWIKGGEIPISPAKKYLADENKGIFTQDELLQREFIGHGLALANMVGAISFDKNAVVNNVTFHNAYAEFNGVRFPIHGKINGGMENSLILCLCRNLSVNVMNGFRNKAHAVEITNVKRLKRIIDKQLGICSKLDHVRYTDTQERHHFLKGSDQAWQAETRLMWRTKNPEQKWITIPSGLARKVSDAELRKGCIQARENELLTAFDNSYRASPLPVIARSLGRKVNNIAEIQ